MKVGIRLKLNVSAIEKARLFQGKKGVYLDATTFVDLDNKDEYDNNGFVSQDISQEERKEGKKSPIIGNASVFWRDESAPSEASKEADEFFDDGEELPF